MATKREPTRREAEQAPTPLAGSPVGWLHTLLGLILLFVVGVNVVNAASRYLLGIAPVGADELMVYVVIWMVMAAAIASLFLRSHINVNLLPLYVTGRTRHLLHVIHDAAAIFACGYAAYASWLFIGRISRLGVTILPPMTANTLVAVPSVTRPSRCITASSAPSSSASIAASSSSRVVARSVISALPKRKSTTLSS